MKSEKDEAKIKEIDAAVYEQLHTSLNCENFNSTVNASSILALSAYFALKA